MQAGLRMIHNVIPPAKIDVARSRWVDERELARSQQTFGCCPYLRPVGVDAVKASRGITYIPDIQSFYLHPKTS
jgi:hypothetical protein